MILSEQHFSDYMFCPALFDMKYTKRLPIEEPISMPKLLSKVGKYFFTSLLNGKVPTANELKNKWDGICKQFPEYIDTKKNIEGINSLMKLIHWAAGEEIRVLDFDARYHICVGKMELIGNIGTILDSGNNKREILIIDFSSRLPDQLDIDTKLKYTLEALAFKSTYERPVDGIRIHNVKYAKDYFTSRNNNDFLRLETAIRNVFRGVEEKIFYPREGMCSTCTAKDYCKGWSC